MAIDTNKTCPVCGLEQIQDSTLCEQCGWEFAILLGSREQVSDHLRRRLQEAQNAWQQRRYNPGLVPELKRDPFETFDEFVARLVERCWYVGDVALRKAAYDIDTGHFPLCLIEPNEWVQPWLSDLAAIYLCIPRDPARQLYQQSATWPLYAQFAVQNQLIFLDKLLLVTHEGTLPVQSELPVSRAEVDASDVKSILNSRYKDCGDGTIMDTKTGLQWMRCALGQTWMENNCRGSARKLSWLAALDYVKGLNQNGGYAGYADWRMPLIEELKTLIYCSGSQPQMWNETGLPCKDNFERPTLDRSAFLNAESGCFWSISICDGYSNYAWYVQFNNGSVYYEDASCNLYVRLVRS